MHISIAEDSIPAFFEVNYKLYSNDTKIGRMERRFYKKEPNNYVFSSESKTTGLISLFRKDHIIETSIWNYSDSNIKPLYYSYKHTGGKKIGMLKLILIGMINKLSTVLMTQFGA